MFSGANVDSLRIKRIKEIIEAQKYTEQNMKFIQKFYTEYLPESLKMMKIIAGSEEKLLEV